MTQAALVRIYIGITECKLNPCPRGEFIEFIMEDNKNAFSSEVWVGDGVHGHASTHSFVYDLISQGNSRDVSRHHSLVPGYEFMGRACRIVIIQPGKVPGVGDILTRENDPGQSEQALWLWPALLNFEAASGSGQGSLRARSYGIRIFHG
jgi:hypothetical protein